MSIAATIGHSVTGFTGFIAHPARPHRSLPTPPQPAPIRPPVDIAAAVADRRRDADQWRAAYLFAASLNR